MIRGVAAGLALTALLALPAAAADQAVDSVRVGFVKPGGGYVIEAVPLETYVARVLAGEAARGSKPAALEALAITIRTFALANRGRHRADGFDLCDQTHCQVVRAATAATDRAAAATAGRILVRDGSASGAASIYYTASCGGRTELPSAVWPGAEDPPYLPSRRDDACEGAPIWSADLGLPELLRALHAAGYEGRHLSSISVAARNPSGRVARLRLDGLEPDEISGQDFRVAVGRSLGWQQIKSTAFDLRRDGAVYHFAGHGYGHGVGLCVIGSARLADAGLSAEAILARYFPGLPIGRQVVRTAAQADRPELPRIVPPRASAVSAAPPRPAAAPPPAFTDVTVSLPDGDEGERDVVQKMTIRARDDLATRLGTGRPPVVVRFHPTTDDYERATGAPWFTSGALVDGELHLLPIAVLRERGLLERTVRHQIVHLLTREALASRPAWVREGASVYYAGERPALAPARQWPPYRASGSGCPSDNELERPVSVGALANAYARARACFARQIEKGKRWDEIK